MPATRTTLVAAAAAATLAAGGVAALAAAGSAVAAVPACGNHSLTVSAGPSDGATGHARFVLQFKNTSYSSCTLHGYPGLDALGPKGGVEAHAVRTVNGFMGGSRHGIQTVTVAPGHFASAVVEWMDFNPRTSGDCLFSASVAVTPANTSRTTHLKRSVSVCDLQVHPTVGGRSGSN
jgi:hypothetical protein